MPRKKKSVWDAEDTVIDVEFILRKFFFDRYTIFEKVNGYNFLIIFQYRKTEFRRKFRVKKAIKQIVKKTPHTIYIGY